MFTMNWINLYILHLVLSLNGIFCQEYPEIWYTTPNRMLDIGSETELSCGVANNDGYPVIWTKTNDTKITIISIDSKLIVKDIRFFLQHNTINSTYSIRIQDVQASDKGTYRCEISANTVKVVSDIAVNVLVPPIILENSTAHLEIFEGEMADLNCYATGYPTPNVYWKRRSKTKKMLPMGGSIYPGSNLNIASASIQDTGVYYCVAENAVGKPAHKHVTLKVRPVLFANLHKPSYDEYE